MGDAVEVTYTGDVVVIDASNDPAGSWSAVGDALAVLHSDLGLSLHRVRGESVAVAPVTVDSGTAGSRVAGSRVAGWRRRRSVPPEPPAPREFTRRYEDASGLLRVIVVKAVRPLDLATADLPDSVVAFAATHVDFPRSATTRQDFGDLEFEAYRMLGEWATAQALRDWGPLPPTSREPAVKRPPQAPPTAPADPVSVSALPAPEDQDDGEAEEERELVAAGEETGLGPDVERDEGEDERELVR